MCNRNREKEREREIKVILTAKTDLSIGFFEILSVITNETENCLFAELNVLDSTCLHDNTGGSTVKLAELTVNELTKLLLKNKKVA